MKIFISILFDVLMLAVIALGFKRGKKDGFAKTVVSVLKVAIALVLAIIISAPVANAVYEKAIEPSAQKIISEEISKKVGTVSSASSGQINDAVENAKLPGFVQALLPKETLKEKINSIIATQTDKSAPAFAESFCEKIIRPIAVSVIKAIVFVLVFLILLIVVGIFASALKVVNKIPLLGDINALLGGVAGILRGVLIAFLIASVVKLIVVNSSGLFGVLTAENLSNSLSLKAVGSAFSAIVK